MEKKTQQDGVESRPDGDTEKPKHPLPTLNLATETKLSEREVSLNNLRREYLMFSGSAAVRERVLGRLTASVARFMTQAGFATQDYEQFVRDFLVICETNPALGEARTTATGSLLWLYVMVRALAPKVIVESGVFKGASLYTLQRAAGGATVYAYDIDLSNLKYSHSTIRLHEGDWSEAFPKSESESDFCYFDDHINNCLRVRQAYELGFRHLIFDDSPEIGELCKWRFPGVPTIQMVMNDTLQPGEFVEWIWKNRRLRYTYQEEHSHGVKEIVESVVELPRLNSLTGRPSGVQTYVRLKAKR